ERELALVVTEEVELLGAQPEAPVPRLRDLDEPARRQRRHVPPVEDGEADAVEADEAVERRQPEVAVTALEEVRDAVDGEAVPDRPRLVYVGVGARLPPQRRGHQRSEEGAQCEAGEAGQG